MEPKNLGDTKGGQALEHVHKIQGLAVELKNKVYRAVDDLVGPNDRPIPEPGEVLTKDSDAIFPRMLASLSLAERDIAECMEAIGRLQS